MKLFDKVNCEGYYKKAKDGKYIILCDEFCKGDAYNSSGELLEEDVEQLEKTYYEYKEQKFTGVIVGFVDLVIVGYLEVIYQDVIDVGVGVIPEKLYIQKVPKEIAKCAIVYYANNKKHYVPIDKIN